jgi:hypothetical protein
VSIKDLNLWIKEHKPVFIILYDASRKVAFWLYVQAYYEKHKHEINFKQKTITLRVATSDILTENTIRNKETIKQIFSNNSTERRNIMSNRLTYAKLKKILINLGFTDIITYKNNHAVVFKNSANDSMIILPLLSPRAFVSQMHLSAVRRILIENNILDKEKFSRLVDA